MSVRFAKLLVVGLGAVSLVLIGLTVSLRVARGAAWWPPVVLALAAGLGAVVLLLARHKAGEPDSTASWVSFTQRYGAMVFGVLLLVGAVALVI
ncbi:hypothetical protein [Propionicimonas sp.]|uniref:hypothetical protein n=1 Tax=Propionicimonas sp. TaxID=1955623 RepID=UPI00183E006F|nr:hypothetical protein [Propionicimonas sp.]MBU3975988.1 hypothetical protein [Actinomycetota bacterium]MBA3020803.1 hypothetical protein [Propionicimonas sp.]MBU3985178.1 hypothetical protein [Actinomycetota bacterium]MBU4008168.1 hypothetical protein [Actinomycetota bacterium]MBU4064618.1 hypothetical protein [Actinomycetota bacterium]